jgi:transporter family-2 protein
MFAALIAGTAMPLQTAINGKLRLALSSNTTAATLISFAIGTLVLLIVALLQNGTLRSVAEVSQQPLWKLLGGPLGVAFLFSVTFLSPRLGLASVLSLVIAGQLITSVSFDHFGLFGLVQQKITWPRVLGVAMVIGGVVLINWSAHARTPA